MAARLTSIASVVLVALIAIVMAQTSSSPCHTHASRDSTTGSCVCNAGFVGDGVFVCGIAHAFDIALPLNRASTTGAIITLPVQVGASNIRITSIDASNADFALFQTSGSAKAAAIDITRPAPWSVTNANGQVFIELPAGATPGKFSMQYSYSWFGTPASDALVVETYELCDGLDDLAATKYGFTTAPELAEVDVRWLAGSYQLEFDVTAPYEHDSAIVLVDTVDFDSFDGNIRERARGSCSAHAALPASVPFQALFQSAPTATSPGALSGDYLAYPDPTSTGWDVSAVNCSTIKYHRALSLSELGSCNQITMSTGVDPQTNAAIIKYAGSIYIHTLQPADDTATDESAGYAKFSQQFPFELRLLTEFDAVVQASTDQTRIHVVIRYLKLDGGDMVMQVETQVKEAGVEAPVVRMSDGSGNVALVTPDLVSTGPDGAPCLTNGEADICVQRWIYRKPTWADSDNVVYDFQWTLYGTSDVLTVPISLKLRINDVKIVVGKLGDLSLRLYNDLADAVQGASTTKTVQYPWHASERIFMRGDVMLNAADVSSFQISYRELWVCYSPVGGYDITLENGGCLDPVIGDANRVHLVGNGAVQTSPTAAGFRAAVNTLENGAASVAAGVSFDAFPLTGEPHVYTIQARVLLQSKATGKKREINTLVRREANSPIAASRLMIIPDGANTAGTTGAGISSDTLLYAAVGGSGVFVVVALLLVLAFVIRRQRNATNVPIVYDAASSGV